MIVFGKPIQTFTGPQMKDILNIKQSLGFVDPRYGMKECELCDSGEWRPGEVIPSEADLAVRFNVSQGAVATAQGIEGHIPVHLAIDL